MDTSRRDRDRANYDICLGCASCAVRFVRKYLEIDDDCVNVSLCRQSDLNESDNVGAAEESNRERDRDLKDMSDEHLDDLIPYAELWDDVEEVAPKDDWNRFEVFDCCCWDLSKFLAAVVGEEFDLWSDMSLEIYYCSN